MTHPLKEKTFYIKLKDSEQARRLDRFAKQFNFQPNAVKKISKNCFYFNLKYRFYGFCSLGSRRTETSTKTSEGDFLERLNILNFCVKLQHKI